MYLIPSRQWQSWASTTSLALNNIYLLTIPSSSFSLKWNWCLLWQSQRWKQHRIGYWRYVTCFMYFLLIIISRCTFPSRFETIQNTLSCRFTNSSTFIHCNQCWGNLEESSSLWNLKICQCSLISLSSKAVFQTIWFVLLPFSFVKIFGEMIQFSQPNAVIGGLQRTVNIYCPFLDRLV